MSKRALGAGLPAFVLFLASAVACPAHAAAAGDANGATAAELVACVEPLATIDDGAGRLLARRLADVLAKYKVPLPERLKDLALQPQNATISAADLGRIDSAAGAVVDLCAKLGSGPSKTISAASAAAAVREALLKSFDHPHSTCLTKDDVQGYRLAQKENLMGSLAYLLAASAEKPDSDALTAAIGEIIQRIEQAAEPREAPNEKGAEELLGQLAAQLKPMRQRAALIAELAADRAPIAALLDSFLTAVSAEDKPAAKACLAPQSAAALDGAASLRQAIAGQDDIEKIQFQHLLLLAAQGDKPYVECRIALTAKDGQMTARCARFQLERTADGWRVKSE